MADEIDFTAWKTAGEKGTKSNVLGFFRALEVWIEKPHVVNRRLSGSILLGQVLVPCEGLTFAKLVHDYSRLLLQKQAENASQDSRNDRIHLNLAPSNSDEETNDNERLFVVILRKLLPRQLERTTPLLELVVVGKLVHFVDKKIKLIFNNSALRDFFIILDPLIEGFHGSHVGGLKQWNSFA